jgi:hypothetical protein
MIKNSPWTLKWLLFFSRLSDLSDSYIHAFITMSFII